VVFFQQAFTYQRMISLLSIIFLITPLNAGAAILYAWLFYLLPTDKGGEIDPVIYLPQGLQG